MIRIKIYLKTALELTSGPSTETMEFENFEELKHAFRFFKDITFTEDRILKNHVPVGEILQGEGDPG